MRAFVLPILLAFPSSAFAQVAAAVEARSVAPALAAPASIGAPPALLSPVSPSLAAFSAPAAVALSAPAPAAAFAAAPAAAPALFAAPAAAAAAAYSAPASAAEPAEAPAPNDAPPPAVRAQLRDGARPAAAGVDAGRATFDGGDAARARNAAALEIPPARSAARLAPPTPRAAAPAEPIALRQRLGEAADLGVYALGMELVAGLVFAQFGGHPAFSALSGAVWALFGGEMISRLGGLRAVIVGGWQASHDQRMRTDYGTGRLRDVRGRKYGEDRYDAWAPGEVSRGERRALDAAAFLLGLPWALAAGPKGAALYAAGAAAADLARRVRRRFHPEPPPARPNPNLEYDR